MQLTALEPVLDKEISLKDIQEMKYPTGIHLSVSKAIVTVVNKALYQRQPQL